ncbi:MAG: MFS transporter [Steroidobacteraceae bacterium]
MRASSVAEPLRAGLPPDEGHDETRHDALDVPLRVRAWWGLGSLGTITYLNTVSALIVVYLTTIVKIDAAVAGSIVFAVRIVDACSDPLMGWITDRTHTRWGRRRPWLLLGAVVCGASLPLVYTLHAWAPAGATVLAATAALIVYSLGFTLFNVPYLAMPVEMTESRTARISVMAYRSVFMMIGSLIGSSGAPYLLDKALGRDARGFGLLGLIAGAVVLVVMVATFLGTAGARAHETPAPHVPIREQARAVLGNEPFMLLVGMKVLHFAAIASTAGSTAFFVTMVLRQDFRILPFLGITTTLSITLGVMFWRWIGPQVTKRHGLMVGIAGQVVGTLLWLLATPEDSRLFLGLRGAFDGFFTAAILLFGQSIWLDTIDYDQRRTGLRREGMYTSIYVFVERLGYSLGPLVLGVLLKMYEFNKNVPLEDQPPSAATAVMLSIVWVPAAAWALSLLFIWRYRLPDRGHRPRS